MSYTCNVPGDDDTPHGEDVTAAVRRALAQGNDGPRPLEMTPVGPKKVVVYCSMGHVLTFEVSQ